MLILLITFLIAYLTFTKFVMVFVNHIILHVDLLEDILTCFNYMDFNTTTTITYLSIYLEN